MAFEQRQTATGFLQYRERYDDGKAGRWLFQVFGFRGGPAGHETTCSVYAIDGKRECRIDAKGRILIEGRWHGRSRWNH